jgi:hypothetical protein
MLHHVELGSRNILTFKRPFLNVCLLDQSANKNMHQQYGNLVSSFCLFSLFFGFLETWKGNIYYN